MADCPMRPSYDAVAEWYDGMVEAGSLPHQLAIEAIDALAGDVRGQELCDLACGQGIVARYLAGRGARVTGIDLSPRLLAIAQQTEAMQRAGIVYLQDDAQVLSTQSNFTFDGVVCNLALMDIPDLSAVLGAVARVLRPAGWFIFSLAHPCFEPPHADWQADEHGRIRRVVSGYFTEGFWRSSNVDGVRGKVGAHHRMLSTYLNSALDAGFTLERLAEPPATGAYADVDLGGKEVPRLLVVLIRKLLNVAPTGYPAPQP